MFNDFLISLGEETSAVTIITGCFFCALSFAGLFTSTLFKKFSIRTVGLIGGFINRLLWTLIFCICHLNFQFF